MFGIANAIKMQTSTSSLSQILLVGMMGIAGLSGLVRAGQFGGMPMNLERDLAGRLVGRVVPTSLNLQVR